MKLLLPRGYEPLILKRELEILCLDPNFVEALNYYFGDELYTWITKRTKNANIVISVYGDQGTGKSYSAIRLAEKFLNLKSADTICFSNTELLNKLKEYENKTDDMVVTFIKDEQEREYGVGSSREASDIQAIEHTCRVLKINLIFISIFVKLHNNNFILRPIARNETLKRNLLIVYNKDQIPLGYVELGFPENKKLIQEYERRKREYVINVLNLTRTDRYKYYKEMAKKLLSMNKWSECKNLRMKKALISIVYPGLTTGEISELIAMTELLEKEVIK
ncbi:MAG: hypothetical protein QW469_01135 [Candidatus Aenigmatarchaeota archaeon]